MEHHNIETLKKHILPLSESNNFDKAKLEWELSRVEVHKDWNKCPCGHSIKELCFIKNTINGNATHVGNVCINKFIEIDTGNIFECIKRIIKDLKTNPNEDLICYAYKHNIITEREQTFLLDIKDKRNLSSKQSKWQKDINIRILKSTSIKDNIDRDLGNHPQGGVIQIKDGPYGPYLKCRGINAQIKKPLTHDTISLKEAVQLINDKHNKELIKVLPKPSRYFGLPWERLKWATEQTNPTFLWTTQIRWGVDGANKDYYGAYKGKASNSIDALLGKDTYVITVLYSTENKKEVYQTILKNSKKQFHDSLQKAKDFIEKHAIKKDIYL